MKISEIINLFEAAVAPTIHTRDLIKSKVDAAREKGDIICGTENVFVHFSDVAKMGNRYVVEWGFTPKGIYAFPGKYLTKPARQLRKICTWDDLEHVYTFRLEGNILDLGNMSESEVLHYYKIICEKYKNRIKLPKMLAKYKNPGNRFFEFTRSVILADLDLPKSTVHDDAIPWTWFRFFVSIGVDGLVDRTGKIISADGFEQAVIFNPAAIVDKQAFTNDFACYGKPTKKKIKDNVKLSKTYNDRQKLCDEVSQKPEDEIRKFVNSTSSNFWKSLKIPSHVQMILLQNMGAQCFTKTVKPISLEARSTIIDKSPMFALGVFKDFTEDEQVRLLTADPDCIDYLKGLKGKAIDLAIYIRKNRKEDSDSDEE